MQVSRRLARLLAKLRGSIGADGELSLASCGARRPAHIPGVRSPGEIMPGQGTEMARHLTISRMPAPGLPLGLRLTMAALQQRGHGCPRARLPPGVDLHGCTADYLLAVENELNNRPARSWTTVSQPSLQGAASIAESVSLRRDTDPLSLAAAGCARAADDTTRGPHRAVVEARRGRSLTVGQPGLD